MKTKTMKRLAAAVAAITMMSAMPMSAMHNIWADPANYTVTINKGTDGIARSYRAYQIFTGEIQDGKLININWNTSVINDSSFLSALKSANTDFSSAASATDVADVLSGYDETSDLAKIVQFATLAKNNLKSNASSTEISSGSNSVSLQEGYYLILEKGTDNVATAISRGILALVKNTSITPKYSNPTIDKNIIENNSPVKANTAAIGDKINYELSSTTPDMTGYNKYYFIINDTLSAGLTLNYDSVSSTRSAETGQFTVTVGGVTLKDITNISYTEGTGYSDTTNYAYDGTDPAYYVIKDGQNFKLVFVNFKQFAAGKAISIKYSATLTKDASLGATIATANTNTVQLTYSNNPNWNYGGLPGSGTDDVSTTPQNENPDKPDEPNPSGPDDPTTPEDESNKPEPTNPTSPIKVYTYTAAIKILKTDGTSKLAGAGFTLYNNEDCADEHQVMVQQLSDDADGKVYFKGLDEGTYWIKETLVPDGYNGLTSPLKLVINSTSLENGCAWEVATGSTANTFSITENTGEYYATVENHAGATLPSTGGIGTTIFYVSGGALILGAGVVLITKKRMSAKEDR